MKFEKKTLYSFVEYKIPLRLLEVSTVQVKPFDSSVRYRGPPFFTFYVNNSFSIKKLEKKNFVTVTLFYFLFYICVKIFIRIERIIKICFVYGSLKVAEVFGDLTFICDNLHYVY